MIKPVAIINKVNCSERKEICAITQAVEHIQTLEHGTYLYAIPEGYHIVAIDHEQEMLDNIYQHNEKVRGNHED